MQTQLLQLRALHEQSHVMGWTGFPLLGLSPEEQAASVTPTGFFPLSKSPEEQEKC